MRDADSPASAKHTHATEFDHPFEAFEELARFDLEEIDLGDLE